MRLTKKQRLELREKFGGRCAYCGCELPEKGWHADHIEPVLRRGWLEKLDAERRKKTGFTHEYKTVDTDPVRPENNRLDNFFPACAPCNLFKATFSIDFLREEIGKQVERARKSSVNFRTAERFGLIEVVDKPVTFWFEQYEAQGQGGE